MRLPLRKYVVEHIVPLPSFNFRWIALLHSSTCFKNPLSEYSGTQLPVLDIVNILIKVTIRRADLVFAFIAFCEFRLFYIDILFRLFYIDILTYIYILVNSKPDVEKSMNSVYKVCNV